MTDLNPDTALLGAILSGYADVDKVSTMVRPADFRSPADELVFDAVLTVNEAGGAVDPVTVRQALDADAVKRLPGGVVYLVELAQGCPNPLSAMDYARQVVDNRQRRDLANAAYTLTEELKNLDRDPHAIGERARTLVEDAIADRAEHSLTTLDDVLPEVVDVAERGVPLGLPTPWPDVDDLTHGLAPGRLVTVGARPGVGKSVMGANLALHVARRHGHRVVLCSIEMPRTEVGQRLLASHAEVDLSALEHGKLNEAAWERVAKGTSELRGLPLDIDDAASQTVGSVRAAVKASARKSTVALVVVDYLQLLTPRDTRVSRVEQVGEFSRGLKAIAREFGVCVVAMAQVNRASTMRKDGRPTMADLRESGAIEADSDQVILLHKADEETSDVTVIVEKNRSGPKGERTLQLQGRYARLVSVTRWG